MMTSENLKIIPNLLKFYLYKELLEEFKHSSFSWHYPNSEGEPEQYSHLLYYDHQFSSEMNHTIKRCLQSLLINNLNAIATLRIKVNATPRNAPQQDWHTDWQISTPNKTCVLYLNDNNGYTEFETGEKVMSVANTGVIFDSNLKHRGVPATDVDRRLVLNVNYFEK